MVCTGKNIANGSKNPKFPSYHVRAVPALRARSRSGSSIGPLLFPVAQFLMSVLCKLDTCSPMLCQWFVQYYKETTHLRVPLGCKFAIRVPCDVPNGLACKFSIASHDFKYFSPCSSWIKIDLARTHILDFTIFAPVVASVVCSVILYIPPFDVANLLHCGSCESCMAGENFTWGEGGPWSPRKFWGGGALRRGAPRATHFFPQYKCVKSCLQRFQRGGGCMFTRHNPSPLSARPKSYWA